MEFLQLDGTYSCFPKPNLTNLLKESMQGLKGFIKATKIGQQQSHVSNYIYPSLSRKYLNYLRYRSLHQGTKVSFSIFIHHWLTAIAIKLGHKQYVNIFCRRKIFHRGTFFPSALFTCQSVNVFQLGQHKYPLHWQL